MHPAQWCSGKFGAGGTLECPGADPLAGSRAAEPLVGGQVPAIRISAIFAGRTNCKNNKEKAFNFHHILVSPTFMCGPW